MSVCQLEKKAKGHAYPRTCPTCGLTGPCQRGLAMGKTGKIVETGDNRSAAIRECVVWLAINCNNYRPEALAGQMACDMLGDDT